MIITDPITDVRPTSEPPPTALARVRDGVWEDGLVRVVSDAALPPEHPVARVLPDGRIEVRHRPTGRVDDDLAEVLAAALAPLTDDHLIFGHAFTGIVLTNEPADPLLAWERFYRNSLARLADPAHPGYTEIYRHAQQLIGTGTVLDLGCGFGFLALHLAGHGARVTACDNDATVTHLLTIMAQRLGVTLAVVTATDDTVLAHESVDTVVLLHVLEHVDPLTGEHLVAEAMRIARHRVVIAVPYEEEPSALYGHVRALRPDDLEALGVHAARSGWRHDVHEHAGGWLILDRYAPPLHSLNPFRHRAGAPVQCEGEAP